MTMTAVQYATVVYDIFGEYDTGSERTLAACLNDASRTQTESFGTLSKWRTGE